MNERTIKIKGLIKGEVCMGTYGLVELELLEIEKEMAELRQAANIKPAPKCKCLHSGSCRYEPAIAGTTEVCRHLEK